MYVGDLATVVFTGMKHTADWFLASFKENEVASSELAVRSFISADADCLSRFRRMGQAANGKLRGDVQKASLRSRR